MYDLTNTVQFYSLFVGLVVGASLGSNPHFRISIATENK